jgi:PAS domain-containing protein
LAEKPIAMTDLFQDVIEGMAEGFAVYDSEERLIACNERYRALFPNYVTGGLICTGLKYEDFVRFGAERGLVPSAVGRVEVHVQERLAQFRRPTGPIEIVRANGTWIRLINQKTADGRTICLREDITEAKLAELALRESERDYRGILDNLTDIFYRADRDGRVTLISPSVKELVGYEPAEVIGQKLSNFYLYTRVTPEPEIPGVR